MATLIDIDTGTRFDEDGFILDMQQWNPKMASELAEEDGLQGLTQNHWKIIYYLREHYHKNHTIPVMRHVCHVHGLSSHCVDDLFHDCREAWRVSGLPNPGEEAKTYM